MQIIGDPLEIELNIRRGLCLIKDDDWAAIQAFMAPLKHKNAVTKLHYDHSCRVGVLASQIAFHVYLDPKALFIAGLCHDLGKCQVPCETLGKTGPWDARDYTRIRKHVPYGYAMLKDRFDFTAEIVLWHHRFQKDGYPKRMPKALHKYSESTKLLIIESGRMLAIADVYDALHRVNSKFSNAPAGLGSTEIEAKMYELNPDRRQLIKSLYVAGVLR